MFLRKMQLPQQGMPTAEEFALWGARELSFEELLEVNGGKREKKEKSSGKSTSSGSPAFDEKKSKPGTQSGTSSVNSRE